MTLSAAPPHPAAIHEFRRRGKSGIKLRMESPSGEPAAVAEGGMTLYPGFATGG